MCIHKQTSGSFITWGLALSSGQVFQDFRVSEPASHPTRRLAACFLLGVTPVTLTHAPALQWGRGAEDWRRLDGSWSRELLRLWVGSLWRGPGWGGTQVYLSTSGRTESCSQGPQFPSGSMGCPSGLTSRRWSRTGLAPTPRGLELPAASQDLVHVAC